MESNVNLEKMIMSLGKDNTDFYVDFDTIADWVENKQATDLISFKKLIDSKELVITYQLSKALYNIITNIDLFYNDEAILKNFRHKKNLANNENLEKLNNFLDDRICILKNKKKKEGNDTIENLKKAIDTKDKIKIGNIFAYQKYQNQYKHMAKLINNNIKVIQEDEIYDILNRSNSVEEFCCNTTMNLINRISVAKFTEGRIIELDETAFGMIEKNYLDINNKIVLICGLDLNPKYDEIMTKKKKKYGSTNDPVYTLLELFAYMKSNEYRDIYNQAKLINWTKENLTDPLVGVKEISRTLAFPIISQKSPSSITKHNRYIPVAYVQQCTNTTDVDKAINVCNKNTSNAFGCRNCKEKGEDDVLEIIIDSLINDVNHDLLDIFVKSNSRNYTEAIKIAKENGDPTYLALKESLDKAKKEANKQSIKLIVPEYNKAVKTGVTINRDLIRFIENNPTQLMIDFSEYATEMVFLDIQKLKETFLSKLIDWSKVNYKEVYDLLENISSINNKIESNNNDILFGTNILLLYSYILELYKRIGYFEKDVEIFKSYSKFIWDYSRKIELKTNEDYIKAFDKAYNNFLETNLK